MFKIIRTNGYVMLGFARNFLLGITNILDGIVSVLSFGTLSSSFTFKIIFYFIGSEFWSKADRK